MAEAEQQQETVTFKLNNQDVTVPKGWTVMQAAEHVGVKIPHFCWHPGLSVAGVCRFCMVKVEGRPKLEISCNLQATDGMIVSTEDEEVKEAHRWALEFHLVNHPLDCPICDQAGECGLQDYYMEVGRYHSEMTRPKVLKPKALDVGGDLVLDTERCILCTRCVRFEDEITKSGALGIFDRGDRAVIGTFPGKKIEHNYTDNLVDICPVGAFTSKDFRFKQRVWFLKHKPSICPGCSTGCHIDIYYKEETATYYRIKPRYSDVNQYWACDRGRQSYKHLNKASRLLFAYEMAESGSREKEPTTQALTHLATKIRAIKGSEIALLISPQYTVEEYARLFDFFVKEKGVSDIFHWRPREEDTEYFDGILYRGDHNPNTTGLLQVMADYKIKDERVTSFEKLTAKPYQVVIALAPELNEFWEGYADQLRDLSEMEGLSLWTSQQDVMRYPFKHLIPMKGFAEKRGHFLNVQSKEGWIHDPCPCPVKEAVDVSEAVQILEANIREG